MRCSFFFLPVLLCVCVLAAGAQAPMAAPNLKDADALFAAALASNGLVGDDLKPWHLKASYDILDRNNKVIATGVFEEWWAAKDKWKRSYTGPHYSGTEYHLPEGDAHEGDAWKATPWPESLIATKLLSPIESTDLSTLSSDTTHQGAAQDRGHMEIHALPFAKPPLTCVRKASKYGPGVPNDQIGYCFEPGNKELRLSGFTSLDAVYNKLGIFQERFIGLETFVSVNGHGLINVHVLSLMGLPSEGLTVFVPPVPVTEIKKDAILTLPSSMLAGRKLSGNDPAYPREAKMRREQGLVVIGVNINELGRIEDAKALEAPSSLLSDAAIEGVRTWRYQPYLLDGQPRRVTTTINVVYKLGR